MQLGVVWDVGSIFLLMSMSRERIVMGEKCKKTRKPVWLCVLSLHVPAEWTTHCFCFRRCIDLHFLRLYFLFCFCCFLPLCLWETKLETGATLNVVGIVMVLFHYFVRGLACSCS